jgi:hypothetical protein
MKVRDVIKGIDSLDNHDHYIKNHEKTMQELLNKKCCAGWEQEDVRKGLIAKLGKEKARFILNS